MTWSAFPEPVVLEAAGTSVAVTWPGHRDTGVPCIAHWGSSLGRSSRWSGDLGLATDRIPQGGGLDVEAPLAVVPLHAGGFPGRPGLSGHRHGGTAWAPRFALAGPPSIASTPLGHVVRTTGIDAAAGLTLTTTIALTSAGALRVRASVRNDGDRRYLLDALSTTLPVPDHAAELLTFTGRWLREMHPQRIPWAHGAWSSENRSGRSSHEHPAFVVACTPGSGEWSGEVWGIHLAWSGNSALLAECLPDGRRYVQVGELLHPGEVCLEPGDSYDAPEVVAVHGAGLTPAGWVFHREVRAHPDHPGVDRPRPVLVNTWEAVYFDHDGQRLRALADAAAAVGAEQYVLDDGWFGSRRDDRRGLGDWTVSPDAHPEGLAPLIDHVRSLGMRFGIWVEPEMVNPDSDLYRAHPDWVLAAPGDPADPDTGPVLGRHQLVLDLTRQEAFDHVLAQLDRLLDDHDISFVKWDMNRPHAAASTARGHAGSHEQTLAVYRLVDELRRRHPLVEVESCASGGGRIDHRILQSCHRVWTSDCNDPIERQLIQRGLSMLVPPEVMGAHIGPTRSHTTGRVQTLAFRGATAMFGHLGIEWDLLGLDDEERAALTEVVALHKRFRPLLHGGDVVRFDLAPNGGEPLVALAHGVYAADRSEALVAYVQMATGMSLTAPLWRLPGLDPERAYAVEWVPLPGGAPGPARQLPEWMRASRRGEPLHVTGQELGTVGIRPPTLFPETAVLVHLRG